MVLNSLAFAVFFLIFLLILLLLPGKLRRAWLLIANCLFYLSWSRGWFILLLLSSLMIWLCGLGIEKKGRKRFFLILPVLWNVGLLALFKYSGLIRSAAGRAGLSLPFETLAAPLGISFYTLRCISYMAEVYRGTLPPVRSPLDLIIYVSFFPQIISGPIERPGTFFAELSHFREKCLWDSDALRRGALLFVWGLFQKIVLAERLSVIAAGITDKFQNYGFWELLIAVLAYTFQIYCDFSGYSDMSRGIAGIMGFRTMRNFRQPYLAAGIGQFWHRWHISLSTWLTDYVYIPLGGNRKGTLRKYINILVVFIVSALWHGSTLNFIFWGMLHAFFQIIEDLWKRSGRKLPCWLLRVITFAEFNLAVIFFYAGGLKRAFRIIRQMISHFSLPAVWTFGLESGNMIILLAGLLILFCVDLLHERGYSIYQKAAALPLPLRWLLYLGLLWAVIMLGIYGVGYDTSGFIYAQF